MADIPGLPPAGHKTQRRRTAVTTSKHWIQYGPLVPWMLGYAMWLAEHPEAQLTRKDAPRGWRRGPPAEQERTAKASFLAKRKVAHTSIRVLEQRDDFVAHFEKLRADASFLAKELLRGKISKNLEARDQGLDMAVAEQDHKSVEHYTRPFVELGFPKKEAQTETAPRVVINIGSPAAKALLGKVLDEPEEIQDVEYEIVETKQLTDGED